jgi:site-specific DNA-methyltransferase (adenine-specific)
VLDPFAGSGTTLLAAQKEGFNFIGIEKEQEYCEIARRRVAQATTQRDVETEVSEGTLF